MAQRKLITLAAVVLIQTGAAHAQNALGGGDALDRNLGVGTGGKNAPRPADPFASRNAIITGEVVGGREFRGRVGYRAPDDFRGRRGSNEFFRFQARSAWSNPGAFNLNNTTIDQLRFGQTMGELTLTRSFTGATPSMVQQMPGPESFSQMAKSRLQFDNEVLTASSMARLNSSVQPTTLGTSVDAQGDALAINASGVRGVSLDQFNEQWARVGLSTYDQVRLREEKRLQPGEINPDDQNIVTPGDPDERVGSQVDTRFGEMLATNTSADIRVDTAQPTEYSRVLQRVADRYAGLGDRTITTDPAMMEQLDDQYNTLRNQLQGNPDAGAIDPETGRPVRRAPGTQTPRNPNDPRDPRNQQVQPDASANPADASKPTPPDAADAPKPVDYSLMGPALRHGSTIQSLTSQEQGRFNELMLAAEGLLKQGDYMQAEQRFQRAVRFAPNDPMALAGLANAQIGAGLYLSAGYTLRALFTQHPEMIDVTWGEGLIPPRDRLDVAYAATKSKLEAANDRSTSALLLAYIGRQFGDKTVMDDALKIMTAESADDPLPPLLRMVWLEGGDAPKPQPEPQPEPQK